MEKPRLVVGYVICDVVLAIWTNIRARGSKSRSWEIKTNVSWWAHRPGQAIFGDTN